MSNNITINPITNESYSPAHNDRPIIGGSHVFLSISAAIISIMAVTSNGLLICVIVRSRVLQTPTNIFIASLAVGETISGLFGISFAAISAVTNQWPSSYATCRLSASLQVIGRTSATYSLMAVCIDRCVAVSRPLKYSHVFTLKSSSVILGCVWLLAFVMGLLPLGSWGSYLYAKEYYMCILVSNAHEQQHIIKEIICSFIPALVIVLTVGQILKELKSHHRIFAVVPFPVTSSSIGPSNILPGIVPGARGFNRNTTRAMRSLFIMTCGYAVLCLPSSCVNTVYQIKKGGVAYPSLVTAFVWLSFLCCVINPVIIIVFNRKFRGQLKIMLNFHSCWSLRSSKEVFTISSGLHTILDATLVLNMVKKEHASTTASTRRQILGLNKGQQQDKISVA